MKLGRLVNSIAWGNKVFLGVLLLRGMLAIVPGAGIMVQSAARFDCFLRNVGMDPGGPTHR
jgi:hypothetical protein